MIQAIVQTHAVICTRTRRLRTITRRLLTYLKSVEVVPHVVVGAKSIFSGYTQGVQDVDPCPNDVVILCHDDIEILSSQEIFRDVLSECRKPEIGFIGVLGSRTLPPSAFWADNSADRGGMTFVGPNYKECSIVGFGPCGKGLVLDGVFLAIQWKKLKRVGLECPSYLSNGWHMYDMHYTYRAHQLGYKNLIFPLFVLHERALREENMQHVDDYHRAREAFSTHHKIPAGGLTL
jgi:hypothetical protein